jgi:hypothetical protein
MKAILSLSLLLPLSWALAGSSDLPKVLQAPPAATKSRTEAYKTWTPLKGFENVPLEKSQRPANEAPAEKNSGSEQRPELNGPTTSGGGANVCFLEEGAQILDLVLEGRVPPRDPNFQIRGVQIPKQQDRFLAFNPITPRLSAQISERLIKFAAAYPPLFEILNTAIHKTSFLAIQEKFNFPVGPSFEKSKACHAKNTRAVILMAEGIKFVSAPDWNLLDLDTQAALIIHEGWRFLQTRGGLSISNQELQDLTYASLYDPGLVDQFPQLALKLTQLLYQGDIQKLNCDFIDRLRSQPEVDKLTSKTVIPILMSCYYPQDFILKMSRVDFSRAWGEALAASTDLYTDKKISADLSRQIMGFSLERAKQYNRDLIDNINDFEDYRIARYLPNHRHPGGIVTISESDELKFASILDGWTR